MEEVRNERGWRERERLGGRERVERERMGGRERVEKKRERVKRDRVERERFIHICRGHIVLYYTLLPKKKIVNLITSYNYLNIVWNVEFLRDSFNFVDTARRNGSTKVQNARR